jgi:hypothetical protein
MGYLWTGNRRDFPDYFCGDCYEAYIRDPATGKPLAYRDYPDWVLTLTREEAARRMRKTYWERQGFQFDALPISELQAKTVKHDEDLTNEEWLEDLGLLIS